MSKEAFLYPGQGSQKVGMAEVLLTHPDPELRQIAQDTFTEAGDVLHEDYEAIWQGTEPGKLDRTLYTQPAIYILSIAMDRMLTPYIGDQKPVVVAGHSLGEFTAATASGALPYKEGLKLVAQRGRFMEEAMEIDKKKLEEEGLHEDPGRMAAILGISLSDLEEILHDKHENLLVDIANINAPGQIVISGRKSGIDYVGEKSKDRKGKLRELPVSIASHSPLMQPAEEEMRALLEQTKLYEPNIPLLANTTVEYLFSAQTIKEELGAQMTGRVRWQESMEKLAHNGIEKGVEVGPGEVLTGLAKRIEHAPQVVVFSTALASRS